MMLNFMLAYISKTKGSAQANPYAELFGVAVATGGPGGDRTLDLRVANAALSQLSYEPTAQSIIP